MWYRQNHGLAMGASIAVILANLCMKEFEILLRKEFPKFCQPIEDQNGFSPECRKEVTYRQKGIEVENCLIWFSSKMC